MEREYEKHRNPLSRPDKHARRPHLSNRLWGPPNLYQLPYELSGEDCHRKAAEALCDKLGWDASSLIGGGTKAGYVFVFQPKG